METSNLPKASSEAESPIRLVIDQLTNVKSSGSGFTARCPAHHDRHNSLSIHEGSDGRVLLKCHAGCEVEGIVEALGLSMRDLFADTNHTDVISTGVSEKPRFVAAYDYRDEDGKLLYQVVRMIPKDFRQGRPNGKGGWFWNLGDVKRVLYRLPDLLAAERQLPVLITEGEKDANRLVALGFVATTNAGGATKWRPEYSEYLRGRRVCILPDNDEAGEKHIMTVGSALQSVAEEVRILRLPDLEPKGDVSDWLDAGGDAEELTRLMAKAPLFEAVDEQLRSIGKVDHVWQPPQPLPEGERPDFPVHLLPDPLAAYAAALAHATQTPTALSAFMTLGVVAAAAAKRASVEIRHGWSEPLNLFLLVSLPSGDRKSAVVRDASRPLRQFEIAEAERLRIDIALARARRETAENRRDHLLKELARKQNRDEILGLQGDLDSVIRQLESDPNLRVPLAPRLLVDDITPEKLADLMAEQDGRIAVMSAEGGIFQTILGRYSEKHADALDLFLKGHSGDDLPIDRIGRTTRHLTAPALTMALAVQPDILGGLASQPGFRGRGLLARFAWACPVSLVGSRKTEPSPVPPPVEAAYHGLIDAILTLPLNGGTLALDAEAYKALMNFATQLEPRLGPGGDLEPLSGWGSKLVGLTARLAGLFHIVQMVAANSLPWDKSIDVETIRATIKIAETFLIPHAKTAFSFMGADPALDQARRVLRAIQSWPEETFSRRELHQTRLKASFPRVEQLDRPLALLEEYGHLRLLPPVDKAGPGRRSSPVYCINPASRSQNPQNPQNSNRDQYFEDSADFEKYLEDAISPNQEFEGIGTMTKADLTATPYEQVAALVVDGVQRHTRSSQGTVGQVTAGLARENEFDGIDALSGASPRIAVERAADIGSSLEPRRCYACGTPQAPDWDWTKTPCQVCHPRNQNPSSAASLGAASPVVQFPIDDAPLSPSFDDRNEEVARIATRIANVASLVTVAHILQDMRELVAVGGPESGFWRAVLEGVQDRRSSIQLPAGRCEKCGSERLSFAPSNPCPACDGWQRQVSVRGEALRLLREELALTQPHDSGTAAAA